MSTSPAPTPISTNPTPTPVTPKPLPWWVSFAISTGIGALHLALRNPGYAATEKEVFLELYTAIKAAYAGDPDFS